MRNGKYQTLPGGGHSGAAAAVTLWRSLRDWTDALSTQILVASLTAARKWEPPSVYHLTSG